MKLPLLLLALSLSLLSACSTLPPVAPEVIPPPPASMTSQCQSPPDLAKGATAQDLAEWAGGWVWTAGCERGKRAALIESWPR